LNPVIHPKHLTTQIMNIHIGKYPETSDEERKMYIQIDPWDTWNMDTTLAHIVIPMLKQLKETKHGAPYVDMSDVPEHLRSENVDPSDVDEKHFQRWDWVMDEMIFAFESKLTDWQEQFWKETPRLDLTNYPEDEGKEFKPVRWLTEGDCDWDASKNYQLRITNGFRLFGKYYEGLWD